MTWMEYAVRGKWTLLVGMLVVTLVSPYILAATTSNTPNNDPQPLVSERINKLVSRLRENAVAIRKDQNIAYRISDDLIAPFIDFPRVTQLVIGKYWRDASKEQQEKLVQEVRELLVRSYVTAMTSYIDELVASNNRIEFLPSRYKPGDRKASVRATIALGGRRPAEVQYQLYFRDEWRIYDIVIEGISLAITYRTSFGEQIKRDGLNHLIAELSERNRRGDVELPKNTVQ